MKLVLSIFLSVAFLSSGTVEDFYSLHFKTWEGKDVAMSDFKGKKVMFIMLPDVSSSLVSVEALDSLLKKYDGALAIIGVPAEEMGHSKSGEPELKTKFTVKSPLFFIAETMKATKHAGSLQATIFQWLTDRRKNKHFDNDVIEAGQKFFVDEQGKLYGITGGQTLLSNPLITNILSKPLEK